jgi:hypothetical protein
MSQIKESPRDAFKLVGLTACCATAEAWSLTVPHKTVAEPL